VETGDGHGSAARLINEGSAGRLACYIRWRRVRFRRDALGVKCCMKRRVTIEEAIALVPTPDGKRFATVLEHGSLVVEIYAPRGTDPQQPHTRDEAYIIVQGSGEFINGESRERFGAGDFLFVPAGVEHRFVDFTDDLLVWVIFYGPEGGETNKT
jgi:mannose-6-phosphate isomerase-like protein (cupin superfamily)